MIEIKALNKLILYYFNVKIFLCENCRIGGDFVMKKQRSLFLSVFFIGIIFLLTACKNSGVKAVEDQIAAINEITESSYESIVTARVAYEQLSEKDKALVSNYSILEESEKQYDQLMADKVDNLIAQIGTLNEDSLPSITAAREAYEKLTKTQQGLVMQHDVLIKAEKEYPQYIYNRAEEAVRALENANPDDIEKYELAEKLYALLTEEQRDLLRSSFSNELDPIQSALATRVCKLIEKITYTKGTPSNEELLQLSSAATAFLDLSPSARNAITNLEQLRKALKEFTKYIDTREKTDKVFARSVFLKKCEEIPYEDLLTYPKSYKGKYVQIDIQIDELASGLFSGDIKAHVVGTESQLSLKDNRSVKEPILKTNESLTIYGIFDGTKTITVTEDGSGWFGTNVFGSVVEKYDVPIIKFSFASNDNPSVISGKDSTVKTLELDPEQEALIASLKDAAKVIVSQ